MEGGVDYLILGIYYNNIIFSLERERERERWKVEWLLV